MSKLLHKIAGASDSAHSEQRRHTLRRVIALTLTACVLLTSFSVHAFGAADAAQSEASTALPEGAYAVVEADSKVAVWYNDSGTPKAVNHDGALVAANVEPFPLFDKVGSSGTSGDALAAIYTHSGNVGATVVFGETFDSGNLTVHGALHQSAQAKPTSGDWVFGGVLTGNAIYTVIMGETANLTLEGRVESTSSYPNAAAVCLPRNFSGTVTVAETGVAACASGFGIDARGKIVVLGKVETGGEYAVAVGSGAILSVGKAASLKGSAASASLENGTKISATAGGEPYGGESLTIEVKPDFAVGQPLVTDLVDAEQAALFSLRAATGQYDGDYDEAAQVLRYQILYYNVTYVDKTTSLTPPTDATCYPVAEPFGTAAVLPPRALTGTDKNGNLCAFAGWDTKEYGSEMRYQPGEALTVSDNVTLYAQWESAPYAVTQNGTASYYKTLAEAVANTPEGGTVKLVGSAGSEAALTLEESTNYPHTFTLDLNGKNLEFAQNGIKVRAGYTFTLTGEGLILTESYRPYAYSDFLLCNDGGSVTVAGGELAGDHPVLLHTGGTTTLTGGKFRGGENADGIRVQGADAEQTLLGLPGEGCFYSPGLVQKNGDNTVASLVSPSSRYPVRVLGPGSGSVNGTIKNAPEGLAASLIGRNKPPSGDWPALRREGNGYVYSFSAPAGDYLLRLQNKAGQGIDYPVTVAAGEKGEQDFDFHEGRRLTAYDGSYFHIPQLAELALTPELAAGESILVTAGRKLEATSGDVKTVLAKAAGKNPGDMIFFSPWVKTEVQATTRSDTITWLAEPETPLEFVGTSAFLWGTGTNGYTLYRYTGADNPVERITTASNAAGERLQITGTGTQRYITMLLGQLSTPEQPCVYALAENNPPSTSSASYTLTATAGEGGQISPSGKVTVARNESKTFTITPNRGYAVADVRVDGKSVGAVSTYRVEKVQASHTIAATFRRAAQPFADVAQGAWYHDAVQFVYERSLMNGTSATAFSPDLQTDRGMLMTVLWRLEGKPEAEGAPPFADVPKDVYYAAAAAWGAKAGVVQGYDSGQFGANDPMTREQLALMLYRYAGSPVTAATLDGFTDADKAGGYAVEALQWTAEQGIITGKGGGVLDPLGTATRAEVAAVLMRFAENPVA